MFDELATDVAPQIVAQCRALEVDLLLVVPYCPQCHVAAAVLACAIERRGVPTTSLTTLYKQARSIKPPRATFLDFLLGCPGGRPGVADQQRAIVGAAIQTGLRTTEDAAWTLPRLPYAWDKGGNRDWEDLVVDVYRVDNAIQGTVLANFSQHRDNLVGQEQEFTIRCAC
jgi:hypothetical protein